MIIMYHVPLNKTIFALLPTNKFNIYSIAIPNEIRKGKKKENENATNSITMCTTINHTHAICLLQK